MGPRKCCAWGRCAHGMAFIPEVATPAQQAAYDSGTCARCLGLCHCKKCMANEFEPQQHELAFAPVQLAAYAQHKLAWIGAHVRALEEEKRGVVQARP